MRVLINMSVLLVLGAIVYSIAFKDDMTNPSNNNNNNKSALNIDNRKPVSHSKQDSEKSIPNISKLKKGMANKLKST